MRLTIVSSGISIFFAIASPACGDTLVWRLEGSVYSVNDSHGAELNALGIEIGSPMVATLVIDSGPPSLLASSWSIAGLTASHVTSFFDARGVSVSWVDVAAF